MHEDIPPYFSPLFVLNDLEICIPNLIKICSPSYIENKIFMILAGTVKSFKISQTLFLGIESYAFWISRKAIIYFV